MAINTTKGGAYTNSTRDNFNDPNNNASTDTITSIFRNTKDFKDVTSYKLMRGVPDFGSLVQFNPYESGYAAFIICQMPKFMEALAKRNNEYNKLVKNWAHIVEYEFKSFDGLEALNADTIELGDDYNKIQVINKINQQSGSKFTLTYDEKSGSPLTKFAKLYLTGIKDGRSEVKTYHGLIQEGIMEPGFENEVFTFLFITTDNTMRYVENAVLIIGAQLDNADLDMYNYTKGNIDKKEVNVSFNGYPIQSPKIDQAAQEMMTFLLSSAAGARQIIVNSNDFDYTGIDKIEDTLHKYGDSDFSLSLQPQTYSVDSYYNDTNNVS